MQGEKKAGCLVDVPELLLQDAVFSVPGGSTRDFDRCLINNG